MALGAGENRDSHPLGPGFEQCFGTGIRSGAGGQNVIDQQQVSAVELTSRCEGTAQVMQSLLGTEPLLRRSRPYPAQQFDIQTNLAAPGRFFGQQAGLVEAAPSQAVAVQGDRYDKVRNPVEGPVLNRFGEQAPERAVESRPVVVLEALNGALQGPLVESCCEDRGKRRRFLAAAAAEMGKMTGDMNVPGLNDALSKMGLGDMDLGNPPAET